MFYMQKHFYCKILVNFCIHLIVGCNNILSIFRPLGPSDGEGLRGRIFDICIVNNYVINTKFKFLGLSLRNLSALSHAFDLSSAIVMTMVIVIMT